MSAPGRRATRRVLVGPAETPAVPQQPVRAPPTASGRTPPEASKEAVWRLVLERVWQRQPALLSPLASCSTALRALAQQVRADMAQGPAVVRLRTKLPPRPLPASSRCYSTWLVQAEAEAAAFGACLSQHGQHVRHLELCTFEEQEHAVLLGLQQRSSKPEIAAPVGQLPAAPGGSGPGLVQQASITSAAATAANNMAAAEGELEEPADDHPPAPPLPAPTKVDGAAVKMEPGQDSVDATVSSAGAAAGAHTLGVGDAAAASAAARATLLVALGPANPANEAALTVALAACAPANTASWTALSAPVPAAPVPAAAHASAPADLRRPPGTDSSSAWQQSVSRPQALANGAAPQQATALALESLVLSRPVTGGMLAGLARCCSINGSGLTRLQFSVAAREQLTQPPVLAALALLRGLRDLTLSVAASAADHSPAPNTAVPALRHLSCLTALALNRVQLCKATVPLLSPTLQRLACNTWGMVGRKSMDVFQLHGLTHLTTSELREGEWLPSSSLRSISVDALRSASCLRGVTGLRRLEVKRTTLPLALLQQLQQVLYAARAPDQQPEEVLLWVNDGRQLCPGACATMGMMRTLSQLTVVATELPAHVCLAWWPSLARLVLRDVVAHSSPGAFAAGLGALANLEALEMQRVTFRVPADLGGAATLQPLRDLLVSAGFRTRCKVLQVAELAVEAGTPPGALMAPVTATWPGYRGTDAGLYHVPAPHSGRRFCHTQ